MGEITDIRPKEIEQTNKFDLVIGKEKLHVNETVWGEGEVKILALHGWTKEGSQELIPFIKRFSPSQYKIYIPDLPGFNLSQEPSEPWSVENYEEFALAYLDYHNLNGGLNIITHSFGGRIGMVLSSKHSDIVNKLILIDSAGIRPKLALKDRIRLTTFKSTRNILQRTNLKDLSSNLQNWYSKRYGSPDYKSVSGIMRATLVKVVNHDIIPYAKKITSPTLLIWGSEDDQTPLSDAKTLEKIIPDSGLVVWNGAGHFSYLEYPTQTAKVIDNFLKS